MISLRRTLVGLLPLLVLASCSGGPGDECAKNEDCGKGLVCFSPTEAQGALLSALQYKRLSPFIKPYSCVAPNDLEAATVKADAAEREEEKRAEAETERLEAELRMKRARFQIDELRQALRAFREDNGRYPTTSEGLDALVEQPKNNAARWAGPYIKDRPRDPWGGHYTYREPAEGDHWTDVGSYGADGREGGTEEDADLDGLNQDDCQKSDRCNVLGKCSAARGVCVAASDSECASSEACEQFARCSAIENECVATSDEECARTQGCEEYGNCSADGEKCIVTSNGDCAKTKNCASFGWCTARDGNCVKGP